MDNLTLKVLQDAVDGKFAAIRRITRLEPLGDKVYPPTYEGGEYATEDRQVQCGNKEVQAVQTVLLDSVQSQANRMEMALLRAIDVAELRIPLLEVNFAQGSDDPILKEVGRLTALEAPHRMCDAIFRDSEHNGQPFRQSELGQKLNDARSANATPVFELCPTALVFGFWDSQGPRGGLGAKVQRALVSEIVGYQAIEGKRTSSRIDPLGIENNVEIYAKSGGGWTFDEREALRDDKGNPKRLKPSEINHGNITPSLRHEDKNTRKQVLNHGGVTLAYAIQHTVLSLAALRRLRFPAAGRLDPGVELAARSALAALGLAAICFLDRDGYDLRSRCLLDGKPGTFQFVGGGVTLDFDLDAAAAAALLNEAVAAAKAKGLLWPEEPMTLKPSESLSRLVVASRNRSMAAGAGD
jgi:CRISPR-associated protein Csb1